MGEWNKVGGGSWGREREDQVEKKKERKKGRSNGVGLNLVSWASSHVFRFLPPPPTPWEYCLSVDGVIKSTRSSILSMAGACAGRLGGWMDGWLCACLLACFSRADRLVGWLVERLVG